MRLLHRRALLQAGLGVALARTAAVASLALPLHRAEVFVDSVGVNTHLLSEPYVSRSEQVGTLLAEAGLRHIRDEMPLRGRPLPWRELHDRHGIRTNLLISPKWNPVPDVMATLGEIGPPRLSSLEGQNEGDADWFKAQPVAQPRWDRAVVAYQQAAYRAVRARYSAADLPIVSPSVIDYLPADMALLKEAAAYADVVAIHSYIQHSEEPETADDFAGLGWYLHAMRDGFKPGAPVMATECGYNTLLRPGAGVSLATAAIYLPRLLLNNFAAGIRRTFLYEFMDEGLSLTDSEQHWGLVFSDGSPKPAYRTIATLLRTLAEPGGSPAGHDVRGLSMADGGPECRSLVFAKRDGTFVAALWRAVSCWDRARGTDVAVAPVDQSFLFDGTPRFCRSRLLGERDWNEHPVGQKLSLPLGPEVRLLAFG